MDQNIMKHLLAKLIEITFGECTKEHGHILSVIRIIEIVDNEEQIFTLKFEAETLKPEAGTKMSGKVCMVYEDGIFIIVADKQKMLIPANTLKEYKFDEITSSYINGKRRIKDGDVVDVVVHASLYSKQNFSCFGSLA